MKRDNDSKKQPEESVEIARFIEAEASSQRKAAPPPLPGPKILDDIMKVMGNWYEQKRRVRHEDGVTREVEVFQSAARWAETKVKYNDKDHSLIRLEIIDHDPKDPAKKPLWKSGAKETMENLAKEIDQSGILKTVKTNVTGISTPGESNSVVPVTVTNPKTGEKSAGNGFFLIIKPVGETGKAVFEKLKRRLEETLQKSTWDTTKGVTARPPASRSR